MGCDLKRKSMSKYDDLVRKLKEIFQIDKPELDFGVYRILNARSAEINDYLDNRLKAKVEASLSESGDSSTRQLQTELDEAVKNAVNIGMNPDDVPRIIELRSKLSRGISASVDYENSVFTHLLTFFTRYYDSGDFISQRRYKGDTYSVPYSGEEVMLHWANKDQYYTKSGENFTNYAIKLEDGRAVRFKLIEAEISKDNRKDSDKDRRFVLAENIKNKLIDEDGDESYEELNAISEEQGDLVIRFEYKAMPKGTKQDDLVSEAVRSILSKDFVISNWIELAKRIPTEKNPNRSLLEKCLLDFTAKNTADYFIHKDLSGFLSKELDTYIKNEVMNLDDIQSAQTFSEIEKNLRIIQTLRTISLDLISFLSQLENFQKKIWLKKKFIVSANYLITLDLVPQSLYSDIAKNEKQWNQWDGLGLLEGKLNELVHLGKSGDLDYLNLHPHLLVDTSLFELNFKSSLLANIDDLDEKLNGTLVHGDNFQALNIIQEKYLNKIDAMYIDPPYNTNATEIIYKNGYKQSSWMSLIYSRLELSKRLLKKTGALAATIDDYEVTKLGEMLDICFGEENRLGNIAIRINPKGRMTNRKVSLTHEYALIYGASELSSVKKLPVAPEEKTHNYKQDNDGSWFLPVNLRKQGVDSEAKRSDGTYFDRFYPIYLEPSTGRISVEEELEVKILPIDSTGQERIWRRGKKDISSLFEMGDVWASKTKDGYQIYFKFRGGLDGKMVQSLWTDSKYSASDHGTRILDNLLGKREQFSYPKSPYAVEDTILAMTDNKAALICDYFAGSGTTGHAVISLNRQDKGLRKYILVEQGEYFETVTKPRIQKTVYAPDWKDGRPDSHKNGVSHILKTIKIESYEDALNNIQLKRSEAQADMLNELSDQVRDDYLMHYMLDIESEKSLLNIGDFRKPFNYQLNIAVDSAGAFARQNIDLVETFNYLLGLKVKHFDYQLNHGFVAVTGYLPSGEKTLVLWRDVEIVDYEALNRLCERLAINPADSEYDVVFINGDHNIPSVFTNLENEGGITKTLKIRQIENEFLTKMFSVETN